MNLALLPSCLCVCVCFLSVVVQGVGGLYWGFVPFLIESFPYDCTELGECAVVCCQHSITMQGRLASAA